MIKLILAALAVLSVSAAPAKRQRPLRNPTPQQGLSVQAPSPAGPEYIGTFVASVDDRLVPLEHVAVQNKLKMGLMGLGGGSMNLAVPGERSLVRLSHSATVEFIVRIDNQSTDPTDSIGLYLTQVKHGMRLVKTTGLHPLGGPRNIAARQEIAFTGRKYGLSFYKITPLSPLTPGEYLIQIKPSGMQAANLSSTNPGFMFGVD